MKKLILPVIFVSYAIFYILLVSAISPLRVQWENPLFFDLIEFNINPNFLVNSLVNIFNIFLIWLISRIFFTRDKALIAPLVYSLSPWSIYLTVTGSFNIYILCFLLITFLGTLLVKEKKKWGRVIFITGNLLLLYSSLIFIFIVPLILVGVILTKIVNFKSLKFSLIIILILCLPLLFSMGKNMVGVKNIYSNHINILSDPGHTNIINRFQGESRSAGYGALVKLAENKYIYLGKYALNKFIKHLTPSTYFTSQEILLKFSFTPPIYFGFIIPFFFGALFIFRSPSLRYGLLLSLLLILPSFLFKTTVSLSKLIFFEPVLIFMIAFGIVKLMESKRKLYKFYLFLAILLISTQFLVTLFDLHFRESIRLQLILGDISEIGKI